MPRDRGERQASGLPSDSSAMPSRERTVDGGRTGGGDSAG